MFYPGPSQNEKRKELGVKETTKKDPCKKQNPKTKESGVKKGCKRGPYKKKNSKIPPTPGILIEKTKPTKKKKLYTQKSVLNESPIGLTSMAMKFPVKNHEKLEFITLAVSPENGL